MKHQTLLIGTIMTMANSCLGAAMLQLPFRFAKLGYTLASIYFVFVTAFSFWSFRVITKICGQCKTYSVRSMLMRTCGKWARLLIDVSIVGMYFGGLCGYCVIGSDYIHSSYMWIAKIKPCQEPQVFDPILCANYEQCIEDYQFRNLICTLIMGLGVFMLESFISNIQVLNTISSFALVIVIFTVVCVLIRVFQTLINGQLPNAEVLWVRPDPIVPNMPDIAHALIDLPSFFGLYSLQALIPPYYGEITIPVEDRQPMIKKSSDITMYIVAALYYIMAVTGPLIFNGKNQASVYQHDNILNNFSPSDVLMSVVRIMYTVVIIVSFPVILFTLRSSMCSWFGIDRKSSKKHASYFYIIGVLLCGLVTLLAILVPQLSTIMDLFSAIFGCVIFQLMPLMINVNQHKGNYSIVEQESTPLISEDVDKHTESNEKVMDENIGELTEISKGWKITNYIGGCFIIIYNAISFIYTVVNLFSTKVKPGVCDQK